MTDYYRMLFERLAEVEPGDDAARAAIFAACRDEISARFTDPVSHARESEQLEKAIRRQEIRAMLESGASMTGAPDPALAHHDEIYERVRFESLADGHLRDGTIGWREGIDPWVMLQVTEGPAASAGAPAVQQAYDKAASALARQGYAALLSDGSFPFADTACHAKRYARRRVRQRIVLVGAAALLVAGAFVAGLLVG